MQGVPEWQDKVLEVCVFKWGNWNDKELVYKAKLILSVSQLIKLLKHGHFENRQGRKSHPHSFNWGKKNPPNYLTSINEPFLHLPRRFWELSMGSP